MWQELIATGFYVGRFKYAPGTVGTLLGIPLVYLFVHKLWLTLLFGALLLIIALWSSEYMVEITRKKDPEDVVIDEVVGYYFSFLFVEPTLKALLLGFVIFRILDIIKPYPIKLFERLPKGYGVVMDDLIAGITTSFILYFLLS